MIKGLVAIVGRPNVGKSTLFNKLTRTRRAIIDDQPGVTRDRLYGTVYLDKEKTQGFEIIDTGGFETSDFKFQPFKENLVWQQTEKAILVADLVILVFDGKQGIHPHDEALYSMIKKSGKPFFCLLNKVDGVEKKSILWEFLSLGLNENELTCVSAAYNRGLKELKFTINAHLAPNKKTLVRKLDTDAQHVRLALVGRPNVGKSSLLNRLAGEERSLVSDIAGTTRDAVDFHFKYKNHEIAIIDTAGIRRKTKISSKLETYSITRSLETIDSSDITVVLIDPIEGITDQDHRLINLSLDRFKPTIIAVNKWDIVPDKNTHTAAQFEKNLRAKLGDKSFVPIVFISCLTNTRVRNVIDLVLVLYAEYTKRATTHKVNETLERIVSEHTPQLIKKYNKRVKFYYATQSDVRPPSFVIKCNVADEIQPSYIHYMEKKFSQYLGFTKVPIRLMFRAKTRKDILEEKKE